MTAPPQRPSLGLTILPKLLIYFIIVAFVPLTVLGYFGYKNLTDMGGEAARSVEEMGARDLSSARAIGKRAIEDSVIALDAKSTEALELRTVELAQRIADFLYERDKDVLMLAAIAPDDQQYLQVYRACKRDVIVHGPWPPTEPGDKPGQEPAVKWQNPENKQSWRHRPPDDFSRESRPLYKEITFVDLRGMEWIKIAGGRISSDLKDVSQRENTYCKAEDYFADLHKLSRGQIYVSRVIGAHVPGWLRAGPNGISVKPQSAYAGKENPGGKRFDGIVRWATPVFDGETKIGYATLALDHTHIMEFTDHVIPTEEWFSDISDAGSGNYAFLWDHEDQCISHPRDFFICGYDPDTGEEVPGWISQKSFEEFRQSGLSLGKFVRVLPSFRDFTQRNKPAKEQMQSGRIPLDCRVLDTAPQCQGWHRGTEDGGSGSFVILWSGLWKFTSYAAVPYYTGRYGTSRRGFGYVTIGAHVRDFHRAANATRKFIEEVISEKGAAIKATQEKTRTTIGESDSRNRRLLGLIAALTACTVVLASVFISLNITRPIKRLTDGAEAVRRGDLDQHIEVKSSDEIGQLARSFNEMAAAVAEVDRMKSDFVATASHELRTPIHSMLLAVSGMLAGYSGEIGEEVREDLETVQAEITRLTRLVDNLLDLARMEARKFELNVVQASPSEMVGTAVEEVVDLMQAHSHSLVTDIAAETPMIAVDQDRIVQVIINLLSNSIKYTPDQGTIVVRCELSGHEVVLSVADNGYGIPQWAQQKIFDKFFQADSIMSQRVGGSGLGLTISKEIVEMHGGTIECESPITKGRYPDVPLGGERKGSVFVIRLPVTFKGEWGVT